MKTTALERLQHATSLLKLDDALLFLNRLLAAGRGELPDPSLEPVLRARAARAPAFVIHFLVKHILLHASNLSPVVLDGPGFLRLMDLYFELDDPISIDPDWPTADPSGFFERMLAQQLPSQRMDRYQRIGLALGLFRDVGIVHNPVTYHIRAAIETELGMRVEEFMAMGFLCSAARNVTNYGRPCLGAFDHMYLAKANIGGLHFSSPEIWAPFLTRVAIDRDGFRNVCSNPRYCARETIYTQFEFNPLFRFPVIDIGSGHYVTVDPHLLTERTTLGIFYDLFESYGTKFSEQFGYVFDRFIGNLLMSACPPESLWWESDPSRRKPKKATKVGDWAYRGKKHTVLFECKSLRPSLELTTYGSEAEMGKMRERIVSALEQLIVHAGAIRSGRWAEHGLCPVSVLGVIVTYGHINTVNGPFMRQRVLANIAEKNLEPIPYVVLSTEEMDHVVRLVELGHELDDVIWTLTEAAPNSFDPLQRYTAAFQNQRATSTYSSSRVEELLGATLSAEHRPSSGLG
jgi:hypothetical protein